MLKTVILWPAIAQAALIFLTYIRLGMARSGAVRSGSVRDTDFAPGSEPPESARGRRAVANQFELPVLFFVVIGFLFLIDGVSILELALAWLFVATRLAHFIAIFSSALMLRHASFAAGFLIVVAMWIDLAVRLI